MDGSLGRIVGGSHLPQVEIDSKHRRLNCLKIVGSMEFMDRELLHQRVVVVHLLMSFLQT